ncbi:phytanoyl-CoA dioxygenase family protein [Pollutibacter soli]|uniref:phytanoyl-CoA dioxygenase family protein n=1 Tax=Pollutibacter soli TaxID=3034157 RepID=UPI003013BC27
MFSDLQKQQLVKQFREDGFVVMKGFLNDAELSEVREHLDKLISEKVPSMPPEKAFYEDHKDKTSLKQIQALYDDDALFHSMMFESKFEELASILLEDAVIGKNMQYFNKPPKIGKPTPPHQDGYYFMLEPNEAVTMWLGLENVDEENGCVRYIKGSNNKGMRQHTRTQTLGFSQGISDFGTDDDKANEVWFETNAGDLLVHHSMTIHRADGNNSQDRSRKALGFIYYAEKAKEDASAKKEYQEKLAKEIREKVK